MVVVITVVIITEAAAAEAAAAVVVVVPMIHTRPTCVNRMASSIRWVVRTRRTSFIFSNATRLYDDHDHIYTLPSSSLSSSIPWTRTKRRRRRKKKKKKRTREEGGNRMGWE